MPAKPMRVIFLDLDGVLNSRDWYDRRRPWTRETALLEHWVDPVALKRLNRLCKAASAKLVFSSTWRVGYPLSRLNDDFKALGCTARFIGKTPEFRRQPRGTEVQAWLDAHGPVGSFVILDDETDMGALLPYLVRVDHNIGLSDGDVDRAIKVLERSKGHDQA